MSNVVFNSGNKIAGGHAVEALVNLIKEHGGGSAQGFYWAEDEAALAAIPNKVVPWVGVTKALTSGEIIDMTNMEANVFQYGVRWTKVRINKEAFWDPIDINIEGLYVINKREDLPGSANYLYALDFEFIKVDNDTYTFNIRKHNTDGTGEVIATETLSRSYGGEEYVIDVPYEDESLETGVYFAKTPQATKELLGALDKWANYVFTFDGEASTAELKFALILDPDSKIFFDDLNKATTYINVPSSAIDVNDSTHTITVDSSYYINYDNFQNVILHTTLEGGLSAIKICSWSSGPQEGAQGATVYFPADGNPAMYKVVRGRVG